jgi:hypothetical protein
MRVPAGLSALLLLSLALSRCLPACCPQRSASAHIPHLSPSPSTHPHPSASHSLQPVSPPLVGQADPRTLDRRIYPPSPSCTWQICSRLCTTPHFPITNSAPSRNPPASRCVTPTDNVCDAQDHLRRHQAGAVLPGLPEDHIQFSGSVRERRL